MLSLSALSSCYIPPVLIESVRMNATNPYSFKVVFDDFKGRRIALIKALTEDKDKFFEMCDPGKESLCLYGYPNGSWQVNLPVEEVPPELPEPVLGINHARDGMENKEWRLFVAAHCDSWLLAVAFYFGARFGFRKSERKRLFQMINNLPSVYEAVNGEAKPPKDQTGKHKGNRSKSSRNTPLQSKKPKTDKILAVSKKEEKIKKKGEDEEHEALCGACRQNYVADGFWICCDMCDKWFHGMCVKITPTKAALIEQYKCPSCSNKKRAMV